MISFLRRTPPPHPVVARTLIPPRVLAVVAGRDYHCRACDCKGHGTHCWCCGRAMGAS